MNKPENKSRRSISELFDLSIWAIKKTFLMSPLETSTIILILILDALIPIYNAFIYSKVLDAIIRAFTSQYSINNILYNNEGNIISLVIFSALLGFLATNLSSLRNYLQYKYTSFHLKVQELELQKKASSLDMEDIEGHEMINKLKKSQDSLYRVRTFVFNLFRIITSITYLITSFVIVFKLSPYLAVIILILSLPSGIVQYIRIIEAYDFYNNNVENYRKRGLYLWNVGDVSVIPQNRIHRSVNIFADKYLRLHKFLSEGELRIEKKSMISQMLLSIIELSREIGSSVYLITKGLSGVITLGEFSFYSGRISQLSDRVFMMFGEISSLIESAYGVKDAKYVFDIKNKIVTGKNLLKNEAPIIEFNNVSYKYSGSENYAIRNLSIKIDSLEEIAIVGENGAGKSTFIKLLLRLYDTTEGEILINGINIKEINLESYYKILGVLFQEYQLHGVLSIKENIAITEKGEINTDKVIESSKLSESYEFITKLRKGFDSLVRKDLEDGSELSTGQKQKIALARLFYTNCKLLILDEPTASIDPVSEYKIFKRIFSDTNDKTVIIISHRFSTVRNAKKIYVFDKGKIIEEGSHSELMKMNGIYADAFNKQAEGYTKVD